MTSTEERQRIEEGYQQKLSNLLMFFNKSEGRREYERVRNELNNLKQQWKQEDEIGELREENLKLQQQLAEARRQTLEHLTALQRLTANNHENITLLKEQQNYA